MPPSRTNDSVIMTEEQARRILEEISIQVGGVSIAWGNISIVRGSGEKPSGIPVSWKTKDGDVFQAYIQLSGGKLLCEVDGVLTLPEEP